MRAQDRNGQWGKWSETREFDVAPMNKLLGNAGTVAKLVIETNGEDITYG